MRLRIRGPSGQSTINLNDTDTIEVLKKTITIETSLTQFEVKYGYPPKTLPLDQFEPSSLLSELPIKLNGEQLIVSKQEPSTVKETDKAPEVSPSTNISQAGSSRSTSTNVDRASSAASTPTKATSETSTPLSLTRKHNKGMTDAPEVHVPDVGGTLVLRVMPDDNSCLFRAFASAAMSDLDTMTELRSVVAQTIQANPDKYTKAVLDNKEPNTYCRWIQSENSWGGQIEIDIFSQQFDIEIFCIDVQTLRVDKYNEGASRRCYLVYSGIHYDTLALTLAGMDLEDDVKQFDAPIKDEILPHAVALCKKLREKHYYTDTAGFQLRCNDCGAMCVGERGATEHAASTGHYNFGEA